MQDDRFEWDDQKAASNRRKHGVSFDEAREVFDDPNALDDADENPGEERWRRTGVTAKGVLIVAYVERHERFRIISARRANRHEQDRYYRQALP